MLACYNISASTAIASSLHRSPFTTRMSQTATHRLLIHHFHRTLTQSLPRSHLKLIFRKSILRIRPISPFKLIQWPRVPAIPHFRPAIYHFHELPVVDRTGLKRYTLQCRVRVAHDGLAKVVEAMPECCQSLCWCILSMRCTYGQCASSRQSVPTSIPFFACCITKRIFARQCIWWNLIVISAGYVSCRVWLLHGDALQRGVSCAIW
jgi:hypothetical protein